MAATKKTDNDLLADKVALRIDHSPWGEHPLRVLDCFGGHGVIWEAVRRKTGNRIARTPIDVRDDIDSFHLHGDNVKIMAGLDLTQYDVIDLDAYGIPAEQLAEVFRQRYKGIVFVTAIQTMMGSMPKQILLETGFPEEITQKCPSIPARNGWAIMKEWLALKGVQKITHRSKGRKHYFCFSI